MKTAILLITGSRAYPGGLTKVREIVEPVIMDFAMRHFGQRLVLMHGDCAHPRRSEARCFSIDQVAASIAGRMGFEVESRPVDLLLDGPWPGAGPSRNRRMVLECVQKREEGAFVEAHAFPYGQGKGTYNCVREARKAKLSVQVHVPAEGVSCPR